MGREDRGDGLLNLATAMIFMSIEDRKLVFQQILLNYHTDCAVRGIWVYVKNFAEYLKMKEKEYHAGLEGEWSLYDGEHIEIRNLYEGAARQDETNGLDDFEAAELAM